MTPASRGNRRGTAIGPIPNVSNPLQLQQQQQQQQPQSVSQQQSKSPQRLSHEQTVDLLYNNYNTEFFKYDTKTSCIGPADRLPVDGSNLSLPSEQAPLVLLEPEDLALEFAIPADSINNKSFTDVTFIVGPPQHSKKYVGHRVLLAMTSPVFETMFYGDMADKSKYIRITDVAPIGFENLLRYAYTDSLNLGSVEDAMLTAYAAKKYLLPQLLRECLTYIEHNIAPSTACVVFEFAHVLNSQQLVLQAMNLIDRQTMNVIGNKSFSHVQASTVEFVANRKYVNLTTEYALFNAVIQWAQAETRRRQMDPNDWISIREILTENSILSAIRFLAMSLEEFARATVKTSSRVSIRSSPNLDSATGSDTINSAMATNNESLSDNQLDQQSGGSGAASTGGQHQQQQQSIGDSNEQQQHSKINFEDSNSLLNDVEQRAIFTNLILGDVARLPTSINPATKLRQAPPEYFTLKRSRSSSNLIVTTTTTTRNIRSICSKFQCLSQNVFIVGLTIPIRLDASSYATRTPKFECHLKFTTRTSNAAPNQLTSSNSSSPISPVAGDQTQQHHQVPDPSSTLLMDTIDESLHISIARDKDCIVRLKRPILIRMGNINELTLTFQTYALDEDIIALRTPKLRSSANFSEQTDGESISWLFFKTPNIEFSEIHYYY